MPAVFAQIDAMVVMVGFGIGLIVGNAVPTDEHPVAVMVTVQPSDTTPEDPAV